MVLLSDYQTQELFKMTNQLPKLSFATETNPRLSVWYHKLSPEDSARFQRHFGFLGSFLLVKIDGHMLESLVIFWNPTVMVFRFGEQELTPTLEEYAGLLKLTISGDLYRRILNPARIGQRNSWV